MFRQQSSQRWKDYAVALISASLAALLRAAWPGALAGTPFLAFYPAVAIAAMRGFGPGFAATLASALCYGLWFTTDPSGFHVSEPTEWLRLGIFVAGGAGVSLIGHRQLLAQARERQRADDLLQSEREKTRQKDLLAVTLSSIGDGVIVTDPTGHVTFLNGEAERLTGWKTDEAKGQHLTAVFNIINEESRQSVESPADKVLRLGTVVGLANHTILIAKDGRETPIDDSGAPIRSSDGAVEGVVLVFRDFSEQKKADQDLRESAQGVRRKLASILSPEGNLGSLELGDLIDAPAIQSLMESFYELVNLPMAIIDLKGKVIVGVGWQDVCTKFHRVNPETCRHCIESDVELTAPIAPGECKLYKCKNNMWDMATPIIVGGQRVGNLFTGQFFFDDESVPLDFFQSRAQVYGFDEAQYLAAVSAVPRLSRHVVNSGMAFFMKLADMVSLLSYSNVKLARSLSEIELQKEQLAVQLTVLQSAANAIVITSPDATIQWVNEAFSKLTGYSAAEAVGRNPRLLKSGRHNAEFYKALWQTVLSGQVWHGELVNRRKDASLYTEEMTITPVADTAGKLTHLVAIKQDISERNKREQELRRLNRTLRALSNSSQAMLRARSEAEYLADACRIIVEDCNHAMVWIGYAENDDAKTVRPVAQAGFDEGYLETLNITWSDTRRGRGPTGTAIRTGKPSSCPNIHVDPDFATWREQAIERGYASSLVLPLLSEGRVFGALSIYGKEPNAFSEHDVALLSELAGDVAYGITAIRLRDARAKSEQSLRQSLQRVELLAKTTEELLRSRQPQTAVQALCERAMEHLECDAFFNFMVDQHAGRLRLNACAGISVEEAKHIEWLDFGVAVCGCAARDGRRIVAENIPTTDDPRTAMLKSCGIKAYACHPLLGLDGEVLGTLSFGTRRRETFSESDLSLMKAVADHVATAMVRLRAEEELIAARRSAEQAKSAAEQASLAKNHFLAVISHELRTPLAPVLATVTMLQQDLHEAARLSQTDARSQFDAEVHRGLELIHRNVEMEARLIDDLLDVTRIERGKVELHRQPLELATIIRHAVEVCRSDIENQGLNFSIDLKEAECLVDADAARLQQVFWNLLKNAIKFTPRGGQLSVCCRREGQQHVDIIVCDNGVGIAAEALPQIFNAFEQAGRQVTRQFGGLGLGLTISRAMVELHGGTIWAQSDGKEKGATFTVRLPVVGVAAPLGPSDPAPRDPVAKRTRPSVAATPLTILLVEDHGDTAQIMRRFLMRAGHSVVAAADLATALKLSSEGTFDLLLSDLGLPDGSGLDLMRAIRQRGLTMPGIAVSGYGQETDVQASKDAGFQAHLIKPVKLPRLEETIAKVMADVDARGAVVISDSSL